MATLRLKFPEKDEPTTIVLSGSRVTLGRLPLNTIQIIDRTLSGFHAEFVLDEDHYRLHDRGSTNGTYVNSEIVTDFHLREACKISFGSLECEFSPESPATADSANVEALPTRSEINAVRQENTELKTRVESLKEEIETLKKTRGVETGAGTVAVAQDEYNKVLAERDALKEAQRTAEQKIERLQTDLSQLQRERESLKKIADDAKAEIASFASPLPSAASVETPAAPAAPAAEPAAEAAPEPAIAATSDLPFKAPSAPRLPSELPKPTYPLPSAKPVPKPGSLPGVPAKLPLAASAAAAQPAQGLKPIPRPLPKTPSSIMKGGTQKLTEEEAPQKPVPPTVKPVLKPPVKLPLQPTVRLQSGAKPAGPENPTAQ